MSEDVVKYIALAHYRLLILVVVFSNSKKLKASHIMGVFKQSILAQGLLLWSLASADASNLNPNGDGCVDPSGYLKCYSDNTDNLSTCMADAQKNCDGDSLTLCEEACGNVQLAANIGCWLTSCWNEVHQPTRFSLSASLR